MRIIYIYTCIKRLFYKYSIERRLISGSLLAIWEYAVYVNLEIDFSKSQTIQSSRVLQCHHLFLTCHRRPRISAPNMPEESDLDPVPTSYKSNWRAAIFQKPFSSPPKINTFWEPAVDSRVYFCIVYNWLSAWVNWIICFSSCLAFLSTFRLCLCATVRVRIYT